MRIVFSRVVLWGDEVNIVLVLDDCRRIVNRGGIIGKGLNYVAIRIGYPLIDVDILQDDVVMQFEDLVEKVRECFSDVNVQVGRVDIDGEDVIYVELFRYRGKVCEMQIIEFIDSFIICSRNMLKKLKKSLLKIRKI